MIETTVAKLSSDRDKTAVAKPKPKPSISISLLTFNSFMTVTGKFRP